MKKYFLKPGTYVNSNTLAKDSTPPGLNLENYIVNVINNPTCCTKLIGNLYVDNPLDLTFQTVKRLGGTTSSIQLTTDRLGLLSDSTATTQTTAVIQATDTNSGIAIVPNGTGAFTLDVPDGTATGGNARGNYAIDLQRVRSSADRVASGSYSVILGGGNNKIALGTSNYNAIVGGSSNQILSNSSNRSWNYIGGGYNNIINDVGNGNSNTLSGGFENTITGERSVIGGGINNIHNSSSYSTISGGRSNVSSSAYNTISGGASNTASTNTHATVVGGQSNSSTGQYSISGGYSNVASGQGSVALGYDNTASGSRSIAIGDRVLATNTGAIVIGTSDGSGFSQATAPSSTVLGGVINVASGQESTVLGGRQCEATSLRSYALGYQCVSYRRGQIAVGDGRFSSQGDAQMSFLVRKNSATLTTGATFIVASDLIPKDNNRAWNVTIKYTAVVTNITGTATGVSVGDCKNEVLTIGFKKIGGSSSVVGSLNTISTNEDSSMITASFGVSAGASQEMKLDFTAPTFAGGGSVTTRVVAKVELTEVAY